MLKPMIRLNQKGFTSYELIAAGVIAMILVASGVSYRTWIKPKMRDRQRMANLLALKNAIEDYYDTMGVYPTAGQPLIHRGPPDNFGDVFPEVPHPEYVPDIVPRFIQRLPQDPKMRAGSTCAGGVNREYFYVSGGEHYALVAQCASEVSRYPTQQEMPELHDPCRPGWAWTITDNIDFLICRVSTCTATCPATPGCTGNAPNVNCPPW